jgi:unsaturated rhamnogalacturonyl hydrolase
VFPGIGTLPTKDNLMRLETFGLPFVLAASLSISPLLVGCGQKSGDDDGSSGSGAKGGQASAGAPSGGRVGTGGSSAGASATGGSGGTGGSTGGSAGTGAGATGGVMSAGGSAGTGAAAGTGASTGGAGAGGVSGTGNTGSGGAPGGGGGSAGMVEGAGMGGSAGVAGSAGAAPTGCTNPTDFSNWTTGKGPADIGKLAVTNFKGHTGDDYGGAGYALGFSWYGALLVSKTTGDTANNTSLITAFEPYATGSKTVDNSASATVDYRAFGVLPLEIFIQNMDARCKTLGLARADQQWVSTTSDGITKDARYWADDMFMITGLQVMAYRATQDKKYLDRSALTMQAYVAALQQSDGLFWHTQTSKAYWGRANGWVASGMTELLLELPTGTVRDSIMTAYKKMMDGLLAVQISGGTDDGAWRQVLDLSSAPEESSCTAMFTYALVNGVRNGWLTDPKYAAAAKKGWVALGNKTDTSGKLDKVCPGTGAAPAGTLSSQQQFYATIALGKDDMHGQAPLMWAANALLRADCPGVR